MVGHVDIKCKKNLSELVAIKMKYKGQATAVIRLWNI